MQSLLDAVGPHVPRCRALSFLSLKSNSQVFGLPVQLPEGQSEPPSAEHCPAQLAPWPQVATLMVLSGRQQVMLDNLSEKVKARSKKLFDKVLPETISNQDQIAKETGADE